MRGLMTGTLELKWACFSQQHWEECRCHSVAPTPSVGRRPQSAAGVCAVTLSLGPQEGWTQSQRIHAEAACAALVLRGLNSSRTTVSENQTSRRWCLSEALPLAPIVMMVVTDLREAGPVHTSLSLPGLNGEWDGAWQRLAPPSEPPICSLVTSPPGPRAASRPFPSPPGGRCPPPDLCCSSPPSAGVRIVLETL